MNLFKKKVRNEDEKNAFTSIKLKKFQKIKFDILEFFV